MRLIPEDGPVEPAFVGPKVPALVRTLSERDDSGLAGLLEVDPRRLAALHPLESLAHRREGDSLVGEDPEVLRGDGVRNGIGDDLDLDPVLDRLLGHRRRVAGRRVVVVRQARRKVSLRLVDPRLGEHGAEH